MSGKSGSSLGTFLFSVPLAAIPLMAIFGIPQFAPLVASPERTGGYDRSQDDGEYDRRPASRRRGRAGSFTEELDQGFDQRRAASTLGDGRDGVELGFADRSAEQYDDRPSSQAPAWGDERRRTRPDSDAPPFEHADDSRQPQPRDAMANPQSTGAPRPLTPPGNELTWQSAAQRFQELGITSYHLEPGAEATSFLFVCSFFPAANSNVEMRFESEAAEPLDAVRDVLAQVDRWQQQHQSDASAAGTVRYPR